MSANLSIEAAEQYQYARKLARRESFWRRLRGERVTLPSLDELVNEASCSIESLGEIEVPADLIVGTRTSMRQFSFAYNFMPLMEERSEFAVKWKKVCEYHLSDTGISESPEAYEYMGKFYVGEGNKRVSVLKSYGAVFISLNVKRLVPPKSSKKEVKLYYEFLDFYELTRLYSIQFSHLGYYKKLLKYMGMAEDHVWTRAERISLVGFYGRLCNELRKQKIEGNYADCLVALLEMYTYDYLTQMDDKLMDKVISENRVRLMHGRGFYTIECISDQEDSILYSPMAKDFLKNTDFIISAGDLHPEYLEFIVTMSNRPLFYVHGNHDDIYETKPPGGCTCIDDDLVVYQGIRILGLGGSFRYSEAKNQYTELQMERRIKKLRKKIRKAGGVDIVVTHAPIKGYGDLPDYAHQGFECFRKLLDDLKPRFWFYGHVHMNYMYNMPRVYTHKNTMIINVSGRYEIKY